MPSSQNVHILDRKPGGRVGATDCVGMSVGAYAVSVGMSIDGVGYVDCVGVFIGGRVVVEVGEAGQHELSACLIAAQMLVPSPWFAAADFIAAHVCPISNTT